jgi:DNA primase
MPVKWEELDKVSPTDFTIINVVELIETGGDPWADILDHKVDLKERLSGLKSG